MSTQKTKQEIDPELVKEFNLLFQENGLRQMIKAKMGAGRRLAITDIMTICRIVGFQMYRVGKLAGQLGPTPIVSETALQTRPT